MNYFLINPFKEQSEIRPQWYFIQWFFFITWTTIILLNYPDLSYQVQLKDIINLRSGIELYQKRSHKISFHNFSALFGAVSSEKRISTMSRMMKESEYDVFNIHNNTSIYF